MANILNKTLIYLWFKILIIAIILLTLIRWPLPRTDLANRPSSLAKAFTWWDGAIYADICATGYEKMASYPENLMKFAFYPGFPLLLCFFKYLAKTMTININAFKLAIYVNVFLFLLLSLSLGSFIKLIYQEKDQRLQRYVFWTYLLFPFSFFFHVNYSETLFMSLMFLSLLFLRKKQIWRSHAVGLLLGTVRIASLPLALLNWLSFSKDYVKGKISKHQQLAKYLAQSSGFIAYAVGTIILFIYFYLQFGNANLFFESQEKYFQRRSSLTFYENVWNHLRGEKQWFDNIDWTPRKQEFGFWFYDDKFTRFFLLYFPFAVALAGSGYLIGNRRWYELTFSWLLWLIPMLSSTASLNRYILQSFPFIFAVSEFAYQFVLSRYLLLVIYGLGFLLTLVLFTHGFWVG